GEAGVVDVAGLAVGAVAVLVHRVVGQVVDVGANREAVVARRAHGIEGHVKLCVARADDRGDGDVRQAGGGGGDVRRVKAPRVECFAKRQANTAHGGCAVGGGGDDKRPSRVDNGEGGAVDIAGLTVGPVVVLVHRVAGDVADIGAHIEAITARSGHSVEC